MGGHTPFAYRQIAHAFTHISYHASLTFDQRRQIRLCIQIETQQTGQILTSPQFTACEIALFTVNSHTHTHSCMHVAYCTEDRMLIYTFPCPPKHPFSRLSLQRAHCGLLDTPYTQVKERVEKILAKRDVPMFVDAKEEEEEEAAKKQDETEGEKSEEEESDEEETTDEEPDEEELQFLRSLEKPHGPFRYAGLCCAHAC